VAATESASTRGDRTRAAILAAATDHLAEHGLEGTRGSRVATAADVSEATVWFHFGTKAGLLVAVMEAYYDDLVADIAAVIDGAESPRARLEAFAHFWLRRMAADLALVGEFERHGRSGHDETVVAAFAGCNRRVTRRFERLVEDLAATGEVRDDLPTWIVRDAFFGTAEHLVVGRAVTGRDTDLDEAASLLLDVLLRGAGRSPAAPATPSLADIDAKLERLLDRTARPEG
jgi:TetR/AcrR family fatty acid metabolism transcriptional regulator